MSDSEDFVSSDDEGSFSAASSSAAEESGGESQTLPFEDDAAALSTFPQEPQLSSIEAIAEDSPDPDLRNGPLGRKGKQPAPRPRKRSVTQALDSLAQVGAPASPAPRPPRAPARTLVPDSEEKEEDASPAVEVKVVPRTSKVRRRGPVVALPPSQDDEEDLGDDNPSAIFAGTVAPPLPASASIQPLKSSQASSTSAEDTDGPADAEKENDADVAAAPNPPGASMKASEEVSTPKPDPKPALKPKARPTDPKSRVLDFMTRMNRPFSMPNVADFMKKTVPKSVVARYLDDLCKGDTPALKAKTYGKAVVYFLNQATFDKKTLQPSKIAGLERDVEAASHEVHQVKEKLTEASTRLKRLREEPEDDRLDDLLAELRESTGNRRANAARLKAMGPMDSDEKRKLVARANKYRLAWRKRRRMAMDAVDLIADGMEKKPKEVLKLLDLETDDAAGAAMPEAFV